MYANQEFHDISIAQNDSQVYEPVKERTPQAPSVYTFLDSSTQQRVSTAQNDSQVYAPVKEMTPKVPSVYTFLDSSSQQRVILKL